MPLPLHSYKFVTLYFRLYQLRFQLQIDESNFTMGTLGPQIWAKKPILVKLAHFWAPGVPNGKLLFINLS